MHRRQNFSDRERAWYEIESMLSIHEEQRAFCKIFLMVDVLVHGLPLRIFNDARQGNVTPQHFHAPAIGRNAWTGIQRGLIDRAKGNIKKTLRSWRTIGEVLTAVFLYGILRRAERQFHSHRRPARSEFGTGTFRFLSRHYRFIFLRPANGHSLVRRHLPGATYTVTCSDRSVVISDGVNLPLDSSSLSSRMIRTRSEEPDSLEVSEASEGSEPA